MNFISLLHFSAEWFGLSLSGLDNHVDKF